jgi:hypothetical protein
VNDFLETVQSATERERADRLIRWAAQEQAWLTEARLSRARNYIAVAAIAAAIASTLTGVLVTVLRHLP